MILLLVGAGGIYIHHQGTLSCRASDAKAADKQDKKVDAAEGSAKDRVAKEGKDAKTARDTPIAPVAEARPLPAAPLLRVQPTPLSPGACSPVPPAGAGPVVDAAEYERVRGEADRLRDNLNTANRSAVQRAHNDDAKIAGLQDYALHVCPGPAE